MSKESITGVTAPKRSRGRLWLILLLVLCIPPLLFACWVWITLHYSYSSGERAGYVQKISNKGWVCKTWEGQLALSNYPGTAPELFHFSIRDEGVARRVQEVAGQRVALTYEQHKGVPGTCWGESEYYVTAVRTVTQ